METFEDDHEMVMPILVFSTHTTTNTPGLSGGWSEYHFSTASMTLFPYSVL